VASGSGNSVSFADDPSDGLGSGWARWDGFGNFAAVGLSATDGRDLLVNEIRFGDVDTPPFTLETVPEPGVELVQVISDEGGWTISLAD